VRVLSVVLLLAVGAFAQGKPRLIAQIGHKELVTALAWSTDGRWLLSGDRDGVVVLWDVDTGRELRRLAGHSAWIKSVAFSADGRYAFTASRRTVRVWDPRSAKELRRFEGLSSVKAMAYSAATKRLLVAGEAGDKKAGTHRGAVYLLHPRTAKIAGRIHVARLVEQRTKDEIDVVVLAAAFSRNGRRILLGCDDKTARLYDKKGKELLRLEGHASQVDAVALSADGKRALTGSKDGVVIHWDLRHKGRELRRFGPFEHNKTHNKKTAVGPVTATSLFADSKRGLIVAFPAARVVDLADGSVLYGFDATVGAVPSPDGTRIATGLFHEARIFDAGNGQKLASLRGGAPRAWSVAESKDGRQIAMGLDFAECVFWDAATGRATRRVTGLNDGYKEASRVQDVAFTRDGKRLLAMTRNQLSLLDASTGKRLWTNPITGASLDKAVFSPSEDRIVTGGNGGTRILDAKNGKLLENYKTYEWTGGVAFSPDGRLLATAGNEVSLPRDRSHSIVRVRDAATGKEVQRLDGHDYAWLVAFPPKRRQLLVAERNGRMRIWNLVNGQQMLSFDAHSHRIESARYSADGKLILTASRDSTAAIWNARTGREVKRLRGHSGPVWNAEFTYDEKRILTVGHDGVRVWDAATGRLLCRMFCFKEGAWAVTDSDGRFDASNGGDVAGLHWVYRDEAISLDQLKERYYDPGLLAKHLGFNKEPLRRVTAFGLPKLYPLVSLQAPTEKKLALNIKLKNRGGGIGRVVVKVNGKELTSDAREPGTKSNAKSLSLNVNLTDDPRIMPGETNFLEVEVYNADGYLRSRGMKVKYKAPGTKSTGKVKLWGIVAGTADYAGDKIDLRYAAKDAADFARALDVAGKGLLGEKRVKVILLANAKRADLIKALRGARKAKPRDIVVLYLAGHGVNHGGDDGDFFYLTKDAATADLADPEVRKRVAISSRELTKLLNRIPAQKQVLILDTCSAGRFIEKLTEKRNVPSSQIRALERLKDRTGLHILAGCAADRVSYEATRYAQGLLTHSLLLGMRGAALREGEFVDVLTLFGFAVDRVPQLAGSIGGIQRPVLASPKASASFDIGQLDDDAKEQVPLRTPLPLVLRTNFQEEENFEDVLALGKLVDKALRSASARGGEAPPLVFVDARDLPAAYRILGRYRIEADKVKVEVRLSGAGREAERFLVKGNRQDPGALATRILEEIERRIR